MAETYYSLTELVKRIDNLISALPTSFYNGIMAVRGGLVTTPTADVVARDCYDRLLAENDELRKERPVRHGRWNEYDDDYGNICCSICENDAPNDIPWDYCPHCGAKMDEDG